MFGHSYFGASYFGPSYFGPASGAGPVAPPPPALGNLGWEPAWVAETRERERQARRERWKLEADRPLRRQLEELLDRVEAGDEATTDEPERAAVVEDPKARAALESLTTAGVPVPIAIITPDTSRAIVAELRRAIRARLDAARVAAADAADEDDIVWMASHGII